MIRRCNKPASQLQNRRGAFLVLTALVMTIVIAVVAFAVDIGFLQVAKVELQRSADAAAIAAAWELVKPESTTSSDMSSAINNARAKAVQYAAANTVLANAAIVDTNSGNSANGDIVVGYLSNPSNPSLSMSTNQPNSSNAVTVRVRKTAASSNGAVPFFFARVLGVMGVDTQASATAALITNFGGFRTPSDGSNLGILPFALDKETWDDMLAGGGSDSWRWDNTLKHVVSGSDGVREINLYPQGTGSPGNRGTVDIGGSNNSTADIARQIVYGLNASDMAAMGGSLEFNSQGKLYLNGDTGISAGVKDELASIIGQPRVIPIFESVHGPGNNATYTIVEFAGIRILEVNLTGKMSSKRVIIQPATVVTYGGIPREQSQTSWYVYSPAWLVR